MKDDLMYRGVYGCYVNGKLMYAGSSACGLERLAENHRNWKEKYGESGRTHFRTLLTESPEMKDNEFRWIVRPARRTQREVEEIEGKVIRALNPPLNIDRDPVRSSIKYGRYDDQGTDEQDLGDV